MAGVRINKLSKTYFIKKTPVQALSNVSLEIDDGSFVTVIGKSGCGKSTLLRIICGLEPATSGGISFTTGKENQHCDQPRISMVFQEPRLMPWLTVEQNMALSLIGEKDVVKARMTVNQCLKMLGLEKFKDAYPRQISGGMAQRAAVGRTLCYNPDIILMDEPFSALDAFTRRKLQREITDIFKAEKKTIIFVTHDVDEAIFLGQKIIILDGGQVNHEVNVPLSYPRNMSCQVFFELRENIIKTIMTD